MHVTIIGKNNNSGLEKDKRILTDLLQQRDIQVEFRNLDDFIPIPPYTDLCIHLEIVDERCFGKKNILVPNQEWFMRDWLKQLDRYDAIFCKSYYACEIFDAYHKNVKYTGFTSLDCYHQIGKLKECFHSSGKSRAKGTQVLINAFATFDKTRMHIVTHHTDYTRYDNKHVAYYDRMTAEEYDKFRNQFLIHIYPSVIEGFGHCINEAKACGAVVLTTNFPPMNELSDHFLIPIEKAYLLPDRLGGIVSINPASITEVLDKILQRDDLHEIGQANRHSFLQNDQRFREQFMDALYTL